MSKFLRQMTALSKKPSDFRKPSESPDSGTVPDSNTVPATGTAQPSPLAEYGDSHAQTGTVPISAADALPQAPKADRARMRVFRATRVEHGHSIGEHLIYEVLWRNATGNDATRTIQIGYDRLAALANVNWKTAKSCLKSLEEKLAIDLIGAENSNERTGKTYRVHSFTAILERRRAAGMEWVEKGRGVRFLITGTVPVSNTVPATGTVPVAGTEVKTGTDSLPDSGTETVPVSGTPLGNIRNIEELPSSSSVTVLQKAARRHGIVLDDDAARKLVRRCRTGTADATDEEIAWFTELKIQQLKKSRSVENWVGMLIASVPVYFEGERSELLNLRAETAHNASRSRELARSILEDPAASETERQWARTALGEAAEP